MARLLANNEGRDRPFAGWSISAGETEPGSRTCTAGLIANTEGRRPVLYGGMSMRYRVAFTKRVESDGASSAMQPSAELDGNLLEGVVADKVLVEQLETEAQHSQEPLDEDDAFLASAAAEVWEYDVVDARADEFEEAINNSDLVLEYDIVDTDTTGPDEIPIGASSESSVYPREPEGLAGGPSPGADSMGTNKVEESGEVDGLNVTTANDPRLGLTNRGQHPAEDWAANTGPERNPDEAETEKLLDDSSTLSPRKRRARR